MDGRPPRRQPAGSPRRPVRAVDLAGAPRRLGGERSGRRGDRALPARALAAAGGQAAGELTDELTDRSTGTRPGAREPDGWVLADDGAALAAWVHEPARPPQPRWRDRLRGRTPAPPTVVLVHGWTLAAVVWDRVLDELVQRRPDVRVVRYDQRGHGSSAARGPLSPLGPRGGSVASIRRLGDDLASVVDTCAPDGPLVLVGHSMGGMALLSASARAPGLLDARTRGLLLVSTSAGGLSATGRPLAPLMSALARLPQDLLVPRAPRLLAQRANYGPGVDPRLVGDTMRAMGRVSGRTTGEWFAALMAHDESAVLPHLAASGTPVSVLVGDHDRLTPAAHARALAEAVPQARLRVVEGTGHMMIVERPDAVAEAVVALLEQPSKDRDAAATT